MIRKRIVSTKIREWAKLSPLPPESFTVDLWSLQPVCWGQALRMNLKQLRASWDRAGALIAPCWHLNFTPLYFSALHFGSPTFLVSVFWVFLFFRSDSWKSFCPTSFCWCDVLFLFPLVKQTFVTDEIFTTQDGWNMEPETKNRFMLQSRAKPPSKTKQNTIIQYCFSIATANR